MNGYFDIKLYINRMEDEQERENLVWGIMHHQPNQYHHWAVRYHGFPVRNGNILGGPCYATKSWISKEKPNAMTLNDILVYLGQEVKQERRSIYEQF